MERKTIGSQEFANSVNAIVLVFDSNSVSNTVSHHISKTEFQAFVVAPPPTRQPFKTFFLDILGGRII